MYGWYLMLLLCAAWSTVISSDILHVKKNNRFTSIWRQVDGKNDFFRIGGSNKFSAYRPNCEDERYHPIGDVLSYDIYTPPKEGVSYSVYDAGDDKVAAPVAIHLESSYGNSKSKNVDVRGFSIYEMVGPPNYECLGFLVIPGHVSRTNVTVKDVQNYRCVHRRYVTRARSVEKILRIIDSYDPSSTYHRTILWAVNNAPNMPLINSETFIAVNIDKGKTPSNVLGLNPALLSLDEIKEPTITTGPGPRPGSQASDQRNENSLDNGDATGSRDFSKAYSGGATKINSFSWFTLLAIALFLKI